MSELVGAVLTRPALDTDDAAAMLRREWGIAGDLRPLPSERDRNWAVAVDGSDAFVLKVSNPTDDRSLLGFQHEALARLAAGGVPTPQPAPTPDGRQLVELPSAGATLVVRVLGWLPGRPLATVAPAERSDALLADLGAVMGRAVGALAGWDHPAAHRPFQWAADRGHEVIDAHARAVRDPGRAALLAAWRRRLEPLRGRLPGLRHGVIHNDANDHNVLVDVAGARICGLLDLGDAVWSPVVHELAVAAAYAALDAQDPVVVIATIRDGFETTFPLKADERDIVVELVGLRLATSVALSAHQASLAPGDPYLTVSETPAWTLLDRLEREVPA